MALHGEAEPPTFTQDTSAIPLDEDLLERLVEHAHLDGVILGAIAVEVRRRFKKLRWGQ